MPLSLVLWTAVFLTSNVVGVEMLRTTLAAPMAEIAQPVLLTVCTMGIAAVSVCRMVTGWRTLKGLG
jgi:hypothetical protein